MRLQNSMYNCRSMSIARFTLAVPLLLPFGLLAAVPCESLATAKLPNAVILSAQMVAGHGFPAPPKTTAREQKFFDALPAFCRVQAVAKPSADSDIRIEIWL